MVRCNLSKSGGTAEGLREVWLSQGEKMRSHQLVEFDLESAIDSLKSGEPVIPVWLDQIHQCLVSRLKG